MWNTFQSSNQSKQFYRTVQVIYYRLQHGFWFCLLKWVEFKRRGTMFCSVFPHWLTSTVNPVSNLPPSWPFPMYFTMNNPTPCLYRHKMSLPVHGGLEQVSLSILLYKIWKDRCRGLRLEGSGFLLPMDPLLLRLYRVLSSCLRNYFVVFFFRIITQCFVYHVLVVICAGALKRHNCK